MQIHLALALWGGHLVSEFLLKNGRAPRGRDLGPQIRHSIIVAALAYAFTGVVQAWPIPVGILLAHSVLDSLYSRNETPGWKAWLLLHLVHGLVITALSLLVARGLEDSLLSGRVPLSRAYDQVLAVLDGLLLTVFVGAEIVGRAVVPFQREMDEEQKALALTSQSSRPQQPRKGFEQGGLVIGMLERGIIFLLVLVESPTAIGFLIAAKSLLRFGDIGTGASRKEIEYILIGTLMSFLFALTTSYTTLLILRALPTVAGP